MIPRIGRCVATAMLLSLLASFAFAADQPAAPPATAPAKRTPQQIMVDLNAAGQELQKIVPSLDAFFDEAKRAEAAPKAIPPMKKMLSLLDEVADSQPLVKAQVAGARNQFVALLCLLGDADSITNVEQSAKSNDPATATAGKGMQLLVQWWKTNKNAAEQSKVVDDMKTLAAANPQSNELTQLLFMASRASAATPELKARVEKIIAEDLKTDIAKQMTEQIRGAQKPKAPEAK